MNLDGFTVAAAPALGQLQIQQLPRISCMAKSVLGMELLPGMLQVCGHGWHICEVWDVSLGTSGQSRGSEEFGGAGSGI